MVLAFATMASVACADPSGRIAAGKTSTTVPFDFSRNHIAVLALINGRGPFLFLLDSGAERNVIDKSLVKTLGLKIRGGGHIRGIGSQRVGTLQTENTTVQIGDAAIPDQKFLTYDFTDLRKALPAFQGILGINVLKDFVVRLDYAHSLLTLTLPVGFNHHKGGIVLPLSFTYDHIPQVDGRIDGLNGKFKIDTGDDSVITLYTPFIERNSLKTKYAPQNQPSPRYGAGGETQVIEVPDLLFHIEGIDANLDAHLPVMLSLAQSGTTTDKESAGQVGNGFLQAFTVTIDDSRKQIIFEPRTDLGQVTPAKEPEKKP